MHLRFLLVTNQINSFFSGAVTSPATMVVDTAINTVTAAGTSSPSLLLQDVLLSSFASNPLMVGTAWMISSAIFTTYSTTKFIKYKKKQPSASITQNHFWLQQQQQQQQRFIDRIEPLRKRLTTNIITATKASNSIQRKSLVQQQQRPRLPTRIPNATTKILSPSSLLTMYRFAGSLFFGLLLSSSGGSGTMSTIQQRLYDTIATIPKLLIPSICLFIANFSNTYVCQSVLCYIPFSLCVVLIFSFILRFTMQYRIGPNWYRFDLYIEMWDTDYNRFINVTTGWCTSITESTNTDIIDSHRIWDSSSILECTHL